MTTAPVTYRPGAEHPCIAPLPPWNQSELQGQRLATPSRLCSEHFFGSRRCQFIALTCVSSAGCSGAARRTRSSWSFTGEMSSRRTERSKAAVNYAEPRLDDSNDEIEDCEPSRGRPAGELISDSEDEQSGGGRADAAPAGALLKYAPRFQLKAYCLIIGMRLSAAPWRVLRGQTHLFKFDDVRGVLGAWARLVLAALVDSCVQWCSNSLRTSSHMWRTKPKK